MKLIQLFLIFMITACNAVQTEEIKVSTGTTVVQTEFEKPILIVTECTKCSREVSDFISKAVLKVREVERSTCFKDFILSRKMIDLRGKSTLDFYNSVVNSDVKINVVPYWSLKRVSGYTYPNVNTEWVNTRYLLQWGTCEIASLLAHETSHKVGWSHAVNYSEARNFSGPYSINAAFDKCCH